MNDASINLFNAIAFPPALVGDRVAADPFFTRENDPAYVAITREFGRLGFLLLVALIAGIALVAAAVQTLSLTGGHRAQPPAPVTATPFNR